jgi:hypothetical protein
MTSVANANGAFFLYASLATLVIDFSVAGKADLSFDASRVIPVANENRVRTISDRFWRRVA